MLEALKRWMAGGKQGPDWRAVSDWASRRGAQYKRAHDDQGFVVDGRLDGRPWRLEWGPPQRSYIAGHELRLRMELGLPQTLQMLLLSRPLMETLERTAFDRYTEHMQTQIDQSTPEEMRWLAMFRKVTGIGPREVNGRFAAVAASPKTGSAWIDGLLAERLAEASRGALAAEPPFVLMTLRGRCYLRLQLAEPDVAVVEAMVGLFETAAAQAARVAGGAHEGPDAWPSTASTAWQTHLQAEDAKK
jgi:hypothetical protein